ncbi:hypothetical protein J0H58_21010 [bacterium]|nr:hypothetical protein [bacterium]
MRTPVRLVPVLVLLAGCSGGPKLAKVTGTVTLDDKPLPRGTLTFEMPGQRPATATIVDGKITEATTFAPGDGVPVGKHKVAVSATIDPGPAISANPGDASRPSGGNYMGGKSLIPARYNNPETSGLTADVGPGGTALKFELKSAP